MARHSGALNRDLVDMAKDWRRLLRLILPFSLAYAGLLVAELVAVARIDWWLPVKSFETAAMYSLFVSAAALWLQLCVIGAGVARVLRAFPGDRPTPRPGFLAFWCLVCLVLALSLLAVDLWSYDLQFSDRPRSPATVRWLWLATLYARIVLYYLAVRLLLGATHDVPSGMNRWSAAWRATTSLQSIGLFAALLVVKLVVDGVLTDLISFTPLVAPFWFVPDELSPMRDIVGQGIRIAAASAGVFLYVGFWLVADRLNRHDPAAGSVRA